MERRLHRESVAQLYRVPGDTKNSHVCVETSAAASHYVKGNRLLLVPVEHMRKFFATRIVPVSAAGGKCRSQV